MDSFTSPEQLDLSTNRTLRVLVSERTTFVIVTMAFSVLGGLLQVLHQVGAAGAEDLLGDSLVQVAGNVIVSAVAAVVVLAWCRRGRRLGLVVPAIAGAVGGVVRLPLDIGTGLSPSGADAVRVVLSSAGWLVIAGVLVRVTAQLGRRIMTQNQELVQLARSERETGRLLVESERRFRRDVAERLHGAVQSHLVAYSWKLRVPQIDEATVQAVADGLDSLRTEVVRPLAHVLHPSAVDVGLRATLEQVVAGQPALDVSVLMSSEATRLDDPTVSGISPLQRLAIMRCLDETLTNAVLWGGAQRAHIAVTHDRTRAALELNCTHDGTPPELPMVPRLGLRVVRSWAESVQGQWALGPDGSGGTAFTLTMPLEVPSASSVPASVLSDGN